MSTDQPSEKTRASRPAQRTRVLTIIAVSVVLLFGGWALLGQVAAHEVRVLSARLQRELRFEEIHRRWDSSLSLSAIEEAPTASVSPGALRKADVDPESGLTVLNLWASWCEPCIAELPSLLRAARELAGEDVRFVFVSYDEDWQSQQSVLDRVSGGPPAGVCLLRDPLAKAGGDQTGETLWKKLGATGVPETFFVHDGMILAKFVGPVDWAHPDVRQYLSVLARL